VSEFTEPTHHDDPQPRTVYLGISIGSYAEDCRGGMGTDTGTENFTLQGHPHDNETHGQKHADEVEEFGASSFEMKGKEKGVNILFGISAR
jgi:hypothetical protein